MAISSKLDPIQIQRLVFDEATSSNKVTLLPMEMAIELDANDGDSVLVIPKMQVIEASAGDIIDTSQVKRMTCFPLTAVNALVGFSEISLGNVDKTPVEICVPSIKVITACIVVLQS